MKEKLLKDKKFLKEIAIILIVGIVINAFCFMMPLVVHAESGQPSVLPYIPNSYENSLTRAELFEINSTLTSAGYTLGNNIIVFREYKASWYDYSTYIESPTYIIYDLTNTQNKAVYFGSTYENFELDNSTKYINYGDSNFGYCYTLQKRTLGNLHNGYDVRQTSASTFTLFGDATPISIQNSLFSGSYIPHYPVYCSAVFTDLSNNQILSNVYTAPPTTDEFQPSPSTPNPNPNTPPTAPTITLPSIDSSQSLIDNVKVLFNWLGETIKGLLIWVIQNLLYFFNNLLDNLKSFIDAVIQSINNGFSNVYNNIKDLFYPFITFFTAFAKGIQDFLDSLTDSQTGIIPFLKTQLANIRQNIASMFDNLVTIQNWLVNVGNAILHPYEQEQIELFIDRSTFVSSFRTLSTNLTSFVTNFFDIAEPQTLTFTLDFSNAYYDFGQCELSFDWLNPYKVPIRACLVGMLCLSVLNNLIEDLPSMFSGGGSHSKGTSK